MGGDGVVGVDVGVAAPGFDEGGVEVEDEIAHETVGGEGTPGGDGGVVEGGFPGGGAGAGVGEGEAEGVDDGVGVDEEERGGGVGGEAELGDFVVPVGGDFAFEDGLDLDALVGDVVEVKEGFDFGAEGAGGVAVEDRGVGSALGGEGGVDGGAKGGEVLGRVEGGSGDGGVLF